MEGGAPWVDLLSSLEKEQPPSRQPAEIRVNASTPLQEGGSTNLGKGMRTNRPFLVRENQRLKAALEQCHVVSRKQLEGEHCYR